MSKLKIKYKILILLSVATICIFMWYFGTGCLIQEFFHIPCLTCGMTRAFFEFINGNISDAFSIHPMLFSVPILAIMFLFSDKLFCGKVKILSELLLVLIVLGFFLNYICSFIGG